MKKLTNEQKKQFLSNERYNAERRIMDEWIKRDLNQEQVLKEMYRAGARRIQEHIDAFYMRYASSQGLTVAEARKRAEAFDISRWQLSAKKAVTSRDFSPETNRWLKLYNLKMQTSRLELLKAELNMELTTMSDKAYRSMLGYRKAQALAEFNRQAGILGGAGNPNSRLKSILEADFFGKNFSQRVWGKTGLHSTMQKEVFKSLSHIYTDMDGYQKERKRLAERFKVSENDAMRLLRTEMSRIRSETQLAMYKDNDFTHYVWVCEPGACRICAPYDDEVFEIDDGKVSVTLPPLHPHCRCSTYGRIDYDTLLDKKKRNDVDSEGLLLENSPEKVYNHVMRSSGAVYGAWNDENDPYYLERDRHAQMYYEEVRNRNKSLEISRVALNSDMSKEDIEKIFNHIFINEYPLHDRVKRFDPSYDMAESWRRLSETNGKNILEHDLIMLKHELGEYHLMQAGLSYEEAHDLINQKFDYYQALKKWQREKGDIK